MDRAIDNLGRQQNSKLPLAALAAGEIFYVNHAQILKFIGEMTAMLDCLSKLFALGMLPRGVVLGTEWPKDVANHAALALWGLAVRLTNDVNLASLRQKTCVIDIDTSLFRFGRRFFVKDVVVAAVQRTWERQGRAPLINTDRDHWRFRELLERQGWRENDRIACVHVREAHHNQVLGRGAEQNFRNSDIARLRPAIADLVARGYRIIRIGRPGVTPLVVGDSVLDLANSADRVEELDVLAIGNCDLYLGSASGPYSLAAAFGKALCITDFVPLSLPLASGRCTFVPKLWLSSADGRLLTLSQMLKPPFRYLTREEVLEQEGVRQIANDPGDVQAAVAETVRRFVDGNDGNPTPLQARVRQILKRHKVIPLGLISVGFAERYDYWVR